jgi:hypothetical protein
MCNNLKIFLVGSHNDSHVVGIYGGMNHGTTPEGHH